MRKIRKLSLVCLVISPIEAYGINFYPPEFGLNKYYFINSTCDCLFVLRFYGPVNPMGSCRAWSVYLTTRLLGRLSPLGS